MGNSSVRSQTRTVSGPPGSVPFVVLMWKLRVSFRLALGGSLPRPPLISGVIHFLGESLAAHCNPGWAKHMCQRKALLHTPAPAGGREGARVWEAVPGRDLGQHPVPWPCEETEAQTDCLFWKAAAQLWPSTSCGPGTDLPPQAVPTDL